MASFIMLDSNLYRPWNPLVSHLVASLRTYNCNLVLLLNASERAKFIDLCVNMKQKVKLFLCLLMQATLQPTNPVAHEPVL